MNEKAARKHRRLSLIHLIEVLARVGGAVVAEPLGAGDVGLVWIDMDAAVLLEDDLAGGDGVERIVLTDADIETGGELGPALTDDDRPRLG